MRHWLTATAEKRASIMRIVPVLRGIGERMPHSTPLATFCPCVVFAQVLRGLVKYPEPQKTVVSVSGGVATGFLWYSGGILGLGAVSMPAAVAGLLPCLADFSTCYLVKTLPAKHDNDCGYFCKSVFCTQCILCQARAYQVDTNNERIAKLTTLKAPQTMQI